MTKFDELLEAYKDAQVRGQDFNLRSYKVAHAIRAGIADFLGCPAEKVEFRPVLKDAKDGTQYSAAGAMEIKEDGYWHFGLVIQFGFQRILLHLMMKMTPKRNFVLKPYWANGNAPIFEILTEKDHFSKVGQWVFDTIKDHFDCGLDRFLAGDGPTKIGFLSEIK